MISSNEEREGHSATGGNVTVKNGTVALDDPISPTLMMRMQIFLMVYALCKQQ